MVRQLTLKRVVVGSNPDGKQGAEFNAETQEFLCWNSCVPEFCNQNSGPQKPRKKFSASLMDVFEKEHYVPDELQPGPPIDTVLENARYALGPTVSRMA